MALTQSFKLRVASFVIPAGSGSHSNVLFKLTEADLPAAFIAAITHSTNGAQTDGGDIRVFSDISLSTRIPAYVDLEQWDKGSGTIAIWIMPPTLTAGSAFDYWVAWKDDGGSLSQPVDTDATWGRNAIFATHHKLFTSFDAIVDDSTHPVNKTDGVDWTNTGDTLSRNGRTRTSNNDRISIAHGSGNDLSSGDWTIMVDVTPSGSWPGNGTLFGKGFSPWDWRLSGTSGASLPAFSFNNGATAVNLTSAWVNLVWSAIRKRIWFRYVASTEVLSWGHGATVLGSAVLTGLSIPHTSGRDLQFGTQGSNANPLGTFHNFMIMNNAPSDARLALIDKAYSNPALFAIDPAASGGTAPVLVNKSDVKRGKLTLENHASSIGLAQFMHDSGDTPVAWSITRASGTAGHFTLPSDGTVPSVTASGNAAALNGGPYVFNVVAANAAGSSSNVAQLTIEKAATKDLHIVKDRLASDEEYFFGDELFPDIQINTDEIYSIGGAADLAAVWATEAAVNGRHIMIAEGVAGFAISKAVAFQPANWFSIYSENPANRTPLSQVNFSAGAGKVIKQDLLVHRSEGNSAGYLYQGAINCIQVDCEMDGSSGGTETDTGQWSPGIWTRDGAQNIVCLRPYVHHSMGPFSNPTGSTTGLRLDSYHWHMTTANHETPNNLHNARFRFGLFGAFYIPAGSHDHVDVRQFPNAETASSDVKTEYAYVHPLNSYIYQDGALVDDVTPPYSPSGYAAGQNGFFGGDAIWGDTYHEYNNTLLMLLGGNGIYLNQACHLRIRASSLVGCRTPGDFGPNLDTNGDPTTGQLAINPAAVPSVKIGLSTNAAWDVDARGNFIEGNFIGVNGTGDGDTQRGAMITAGRLNADVLSENKILARTVLSSGDDLAYFNDPDRHTDWTYWNGKNYAQITTELRDMFKAKDSGMARGRGRTFGRWTEAGKENRGDTHTASVSIDAIDGLIPIAGAVDGTVTLSAIDPVQDIVLTFIGALNGSVTVPRGQISADFTMMRDTSGVSAIVTNDAGLYKIDLGLIEVTAPDEYTTGLCVIGVA